MPDLPKPTVADALVPPAAGSPHGAIQCSTHRIYGMECSEFEALCTRAADHCESCGVAAEETPKGRLVIDHDHRYGNAAVRGLLCSSCNTVLGVLETRPASARTAELRQFDSYLKRAWFLQVARWGRFYSDKLKAATEDRSLIHSVLRSSFVRTLTAATEQHPQVDIIPVITPGSIRLRVDVTHKIAEVRDSLVMTRLLCTRQRDLSFQSVMFRQGGASTAFATPSKAAAHVRAFRRKATLVA